MKCDDDTFVRIDFVLDQVKKIQSGGSLYVGNINYYHRHLRYGKWAVTYKEWQEEVYPPYASGPGYVISSDICSVYCIRVRQSDTKTVQDGRREYGHVDREVQQHSSTSGVFA